MLKFEKHGQNNLTIVTHKNSPPTYRIRAACTVSPSGQLPYAFGGSFSLIYSLAFQMMIL